MFQDSDLAENLFINTYLVQKTRKFVLLVSDGGLSYSQNVITS
jgi:hypothetical protein